MTVACLIRLGAIVFLRSEANFKISQSLHNLILASVWFSRNSSSDIIILGKYHFSIFDFYTYSPTIRWEAGLSYVQIEVFKLLAFFTIRYHYL